ncbi:MAG: hypothetical protein MZW92_40870 [Comamonadaceae bacterium]|nr:hypothetical protein [Comamonadaceae bacterium]
MTLLVVPRHDPTQPEAPRPDRLFLETACAHLEPRRLPHDRVARGRTRLRRDLGRGRHRRDPGPCRGTGARGGAPGGTRTSFRR